MGKGQDILDAYLAHPPIKSMYLEFEKGFFNGEIEKVLKGDPPYTTSGLAASPLGQDPERVSIFISNYFNPENIPNGQIQEILEKLISENSTSALALDYLRSYIFHYKKDPRVKHKIWRLDTSKIIDRFNSSPFKGLSIKEWKGINWIAADINSRHDKKLELEVLGDKPVE